jgi:hypothetical protein
MDRVGRWVDLEHGPSGGDPVHGARLRATGMVVFATVDGPVRRRHPPSDHTRPGPATTGVAEAGVWRRRAVRSVCWLLGR